MSRGMAKGDPEVLMLLEGTYPYVRGGVSSWIHQIIRGMPEMTFDLLFIGGSRRHYAAMQYDLPENVRKLTCHYLEDAWEDRRGHSQEGPRAALAEVERYHASFRSGCPKDADLFALLDLVASEKPGITHDQFLFSRAAWDTIVRAYEEHCTDPSFLNYFWTVRSMHAPVFLLAEVARRTRPPFGPRARDPPRRSARPSAPAGHRRRRPRPPAARGRRTSDAAGPASWTSGGGPP